MPLSDEPWGGGRRGVRTREGASHDVPFQGDGTIPMKAM
jgi:hypothetical protein